MTSISTLLRLVLLFAAATIGLASVPLARAKTENLALPPGAITILDEIYSFDLDRGIADSRRLEEQQPDHPLGYLLEAEARWWKIWCLAADYKYGMTNVQRRGKLPGDEPYLELSKKALAIAESHIKQRDAADMELYAGMAEAAEARIYGLRGENRATAHAGVKAREHFLRALQLDPELADADCGLGLYNYYADTLSAVVKFLSFFMGIPGGNKHEGIAQLHRAMAEGVITPAVARFYLALDLHKYDQQYEEALALMGPLVEKYPSNPFFQLAEGDLYGKLGRRQQAFASYRAAEAIAVNDEECRTHIHELVRISMIAQGFTETPLTH
jgi:tetratricopeptide (TPR) repeat protein